jgi:hypothetical protein
LNAQLLRYECSGACRLLYSPARFFRILQNGFGLSCACKIGHSLWESAYVIIAISDMVLMTAISVTEDVKQKLLRVALELQLKLGRRVDLNEVLRFLVDQREKKPQLLEEACSPMIGAEEAIDELERERKLDETRLERKIGRGR